MLAILIYDITKTLMVNCFANNFFKIALSFEKQIKNTSYFSTICCQLYQSHFAC